ncbi:unnamed protein product [Ixodes pacificus]
MADGILRKWRFFSVPRIRETASLGCSARLPNRKGSFAAKHFTCTRREKCYSKVDRAVLHLLPMSRIAKQARPVFTSQGTLTTFLVKLCLLSIPAPLRTCSASRKGHVFSVPGKRKVATNVNFCF